MNTPRQLSPYERTQLLKHNRTESELLAAGEVPVEYLTGVVQFAGHDFVVTPDTLIPRIETEGLVEHADALLKEIACTLDTEQLLLADVGTGCGAIAITLSLLMLSRDQHHLIWASDISEEAIEIAKQNAQQLLPPTDQDNVSFLVADLLTGYPTDIRFHCIIANLPYIPTSRIPTLTESVKDYEPHLALDGGSDGLRLIFAFLDQAHSYLAPGGKVLLEVDYTHDSAAFSPYLDRWKVSTFIDDFLRQRFALLTLR